MHLESYNIEIKINDTGKIIPVDLFYVLGETEQDRKMMAAKMKIQLAKRAGNKTYSVVYMTRGVVFFNNN